MKENNNHTCEVYHFDLYGTREEKYDYLRSHDLESVEWQQLNPQAPQFFFVPKDFSLQAEYEQGFKIDELMKVGACGIVTSRDSLLIKSSIAELEIVKSDFNKLSEEEFRRKYEIKDNSDWTYASAKSSINFTNIIPILYRPFDKRYVLYTSQKGVISRPRYEIMRHLLYGYYRDTEGIVGHASERADNATLGSVAHSHPQHGNLCAIDGGILDFDNIALNVCKQQSTFDFQHILVSEFITDKCTISSQTKEAGYCFPLYLYPEEGSIDTERRVNMDEAIMERIAKIVGNASERCCNSQRLEALATDFQHSEMLATNIFDYIYGVLHSPTYRERYKEFLKVDFPRIPYPQDAAAFEHFRRYGEQLRRLHLMQTMPSMTATFPIDGDSVVEQVVYDEGELHRAPRVYINKTQYFDNVPREAWEMYIGGYQPAQKWLKDRKERALSFDDIQHYCRIIGILYDTRLLSNGLL